MPSYRVKQEVNMKEIENGNIDRDRKEKYGCMIDSWMVVVISVSMAMIFIGFTF